MKKKISKNEDEGLEKEEDDTGKEDGVTGKKRMKKCQQSDQPHQLAYGQL